MMFATLFLNKDLVHKNLLTLEPINYIDLFFEEDNPVALVKRKKLIAVNSL
jgi:hypothetical protein